MKTGKGRVAFDEHYAQLFADEYTQIQLACAADYLPACIVRSDKWAIVRQQWLDRGFDFSEIPWAKGVVYWPKGVIKGTVLPGLEPGWIYPLSPSSLLPVRALSIQPNDVVFDACAAPGGKTIALARAVDPAAGAVYANDLSPARSSRLKRSIHQFGLDDRVHISVGPAEIVARRSDRQFTKILVDAPCSSEVHVLGSPIHMDQWSHKRIMVLQKRQISLLQSLLPRLVPGGRLVYSTCALTPEENEQVVMQVMYANQRGYRLVKADWTGCPGQPGRDNMEINPNLIWRVWPHIDHLEPMFVAVFERLDTVQ